MKSSMRVSRGELAIVVAAACGLVGCEDPRTERPDDIRTYTVAKTPPASTPPRETVGPPAGVSPPSASPVRYEVPEGWQDLGGSGMRLTTLAIGPADAGQEVTLSRARGTIRDNVIRWQKQIVGDAEATAVEAAADRSLAAAETVDVVGMPATIVLLDATGFPDATGAAGQAILAAIVPTGDDSLFVKFRGAADVAAREKDNFRRFVASLRWQ